MRNLSRSKKSIFALSFQSLGFVALVLLLSMGPTQSLQAQTEGPPNTPSTTADQELAPKVIVFYSSIGMGHLSAARAIEQNIKARDPRAIVILKNIRDFMGKAHAHVDEKLYWYVVKNRPETFDKLFRKSMERGSTVASLSDLPKDYSVDKVHEFIVNNNPTSIIATHFGSAQILGDLKTQGKLPLLPVGWLHTDYFTGYFPRISERLDKTFLGMPLMQETWIGHGIAPEKVAITGMPINPAIFETIDKTEFLRSKNLNPDVLTIVLASGGEGVGDFPLIVKRLTENIKGPLQIVAVCAKNEKHFENLTKMLPQMPADVKLVITRMIPNGELLNYIKSSNLFITKSGGLSPTEGFAITKPMVLLDVYGGHERDNANLFEREGFAVVNRNQSDIGADVLKVLSNPELQARMIEKQLQFRNSFNLGAITDFAFSKPERTEQVVPKFYLGVQNGEKIGNSAQVLNQLEKESPADIEIILSYGKSNHGKYFSGDSNPFGHLAVRIGSTVYTVNGRAQPGVEPVLVHSTSLQEYLYGVDRPYQNVEHTDAFGSAYGRNNISVRVKGITASEIKTMLAEISVINEQWNNREIVWDAKGFNCADFVARILKSGGIQPQTTLKMGDVNKGKQITFPLDTFDAFRLRFEGDPKLRTELVLYEAASDAKGAFKTTRLPLSIRQLKRSLKNILFKTLDPIEVRVGKRVSIDSEAKAVLENRNAISAEVQKEQQRVHTDLQIRRLEDLLANEKEVERLQAEINQKSLTSANLVTEIQSKLKMMPPTEIELLVAGRPEEIQNPERRATGIALFQKIKDWDTAAKAVQSSLDLMGQKELDYFIEGTRFVIQQSLQNIKAAGNQERTAIFEALAKETENNYRQYAENRSQFGLPKDGPLRTFPFREFFVSAKKFLDLLDRSPELKAPLLKGFWSMLATRTKKLFNTMKMIVRLTPPTLNVLFNLWFKPQSPAGQSPLLSSLNRVVNELARQLNITVKIKGENKLPQAGAFDGKTVYIVAPTHRDPLFDTMITAKLGADNMLTVMATDQIILNKSVADKVDAVDSIITVGRGSGFPVRKIIDQLNRRKSNTILLFPEGSVSSGFSETRPLREKFAHGLLADLQAQGIKTVVIPVTFENSARFVFDSSISSLFSKLSKGAQPTELSVQVHDPIDQTTMNIVKAATNEATAVNRLIRSFWLEQLPTDQNHLMGTLRPQKALQTFEEQTGKSLTPAINKCGKVHSLVSP